jgi:hypothetical protein
MDEIVAAALRKWPNVPHCHGWLALDSRGHWYMRDDRVQAAGDFPQVKGSRITHDKLLAFIHRNYAADEHGAWYFQNGPQRVYVTLEAAPFVWRLHAAVDGAPPPVTAHTGQTTESQAVWLDDEGRVFLKTPLGFGLVHTLDTGLLADALGPALDAALQEQEAAPGSFAVMPSVLGPVGRLRFADMPARFGYVLHPRPA